MNNIRIELDFNLVKNKRVNYLVLFYLRTFSIYAEKLDKRIIQKNKTELNCFVRKNNSLNKNNVYKSLTALKEYGIIIDRGDYYELKDPIGSNISIDLDDAQRIIEYFYNQDDLVVFLWLLRRFNMNRYDYCTFTKKDIVEKCLGLKYNTGSCGKVSDILDRLKKIGLLNYTCFRSGKTFVNRIDYISTHLCRKDIPPYFNGRKYLYDLVYVRDMADVYYVCDENKDWFRYWEIE